MKVQIEIKVEFKNIYIAEIFFKALKPEEKPIPTSRSRALIKFKGREIRIQIIAPDLTSARAAINSWLRWINAINNSLSEVTSIFKDFC